jgi:hypothetical protein
LFKEEDESIIHSKLKINLQGKVGNFSLYGAAPFLLQSPITIEELETDTRRYVELCEEDTHDF